MIALIQRVLNASVTADGQPQGRIAEGLVVFVCAEKNDTVSDAEALADRVLNYRVFSDENDRMNLSLKDIRGQIAIVSQFTLAADTSSGTRPSLSGAAPAPLAEELYERFVCRVAQSGFNPITGVFGANMLISLTNNGPVTFWLSYPKKRPEGKTSG